MATEERTEVRREEQVVVFSLANENYGLEISRIQGIITMPEVTRVPRSPEFVDGVINLRGTIVPVIDLRKRFHLPERTDTRDTRIINVEVGTTVGLVVDAVAEVLTIPGEAIELAPELVTTIEAGYIRAIARLDERLVILLDVDRVVTVREQEELVAMSLETEVEEAVAA